VIFIAVRDGDAVGFTQLYPSFSSGALARIYVLNDLFVDPNARRAGAGAALLEAAADYARRVGAIRLVLSTELTNIPAQALYEKLGWKRNIEFCTYQLGLRQAVRALLPSGPLRAVSAYASAAYNGACSVSLPGFFCASLPLRP